MTPKSTAVFHSTHITGAEVPKTIVLLRFPAGFMAMGAAGVGGMNPDLQPSGVISNLSECGLLARPPSARAQFQHLMLLLFHLLSLCRQERQIQKPQGSWLRKSKLSFHLPGKESVRSQLFPQLAKHSSCLLYCLTAGV